MWGPRSIRWPSKPECIEASRFSAKPAAVIYHPKAAASQLNSYRISIKRVALPRLLSTVNAIIDEIENGCFQRDVSNQHVDKKSLCGLGANLIRFIVFFCHDTSAGYAIFACISIQ